MEKDDISFMAEKYYFNYRVAAYIEYKNKILLHRPYETSYWNLVGGRVKYGEDTKTAIIRELKEEINFDVEDRKFKTLLFQENFFGNEKVDCHELLVVYHIKVNSKDEITQQDEFTLGEIVFKWFDKEDVKNYEIKPVVIYDMVKWKKKNFRHGFEFKEKK